MAININQFYQRTKPLPLHIERGSKPAALPSQKGPCSPCEDESLRSLRTATANVLTLNQAGPWRNTTARTEQSKKQFAEQGFHIIGIQESRTKQQGHIVKHSNTTARTEHLQNAIRGAGLLHRRHPRKPDEATQQFRQICCAATAQGHFGVQRIKKQWQTNNCSLNIEHRHLRILAEDPRFLIVALNIQSLKLLILVVHCPSSDSPGLTRWWNSLDNAIHGGYKQ